MEVASVPAQPHSRERLASLEGNASGSGRAPRGMRMITGMGSRPLLEKQSCLQSRSSVVPRSPSARAVISEPRSSATDWFV